MNTYLIVNYAHFQRKNYDKLINLFLYNRRWGSTDEFQPGKQPESDIYLEQSGEIGESKGVLRFKKLRRFDDGLYECIARNAAGTAIEVGHIAVEYAPTFEYMESLPPVYTWNEQRANLSCLAESIWIINILLTYKLYDMIN